MLTRGYVRVEGDPTDPESGVDSGFKIYANMCRDKDMLSIIVTGSDNQFTITALFDNHPVQGVNPGGGTLLFREDQGQVVLVRTAARLYAAVDAGGLRRRCHRYHDHRHGEKGDCRLL